jgi:hypothetical protein
MNIRSLRAAIDYGWRNGTSTVAVNLHAAFNDLREVRPSVIESRSETGDLTISCVGLADELERLLPFLEKQREAGSGRVVSHSTYRGTYSDFTSGKPPGDPCLLLAESSRRRALKLSKKSSIVLPLRLSLVVPLAGEPPLTRVSRKDRQQFQRQQRRAAFSLERGTTVGDLAEFYNYMHLPTMNARHGESLRSEAWDVALHSLFNHGVLFFLCESGTRVAGMLCRVDRAERKLTVRLVGVREGSSAYYRSGVYMALYIMVLEWASNQGLTKADLSISEPFLSKGVLQFKRKLHPHFQLPENYMKTRRIWLQAAHDCPSVRDFLVANPVIAITPSEQLRPTYFYDSVRPPRRDLKWSSPGLHGEELIDLDDFLH